MFSEHGKLSGSRVLEKSVNPSHDFRATVSFSNLQDTNERTPLGGVGKDVVSVLDACWHRGDRAVRVGDGGAEALVVVFREHLKHSGNLELPSDWLYPDAANHALSCSKATAYGDDCAWKGHDCNVLILVPVNVHEIVCGVVAVGVTVDGSAWEGNGADQVERPVPERYDIPEGAV
jgi:hypothetical protein